MISRSYRLCLQAVLAVVFEGLVPACAEPSGAAVLRWQGELMESTGGVRAEWGWRGSGVDWRRMVGLVRSEAHQGLVGSYSQRWSCLSEWKSGSGSHRGRWRAAGPGPSRKALPVACSPAGLETENERNVCRQADQSMKGLSLKCSTENLSKEPKAFVNFQKCRSYLYWQWSYSLFH